jgi:hypothetical protein
MYTHGSVQWPQKGLSGGKMARNGRKMARNGVGAARPLAVALQSKMGGKPRGFPGGGNPGRGWGPKMHIPY